MTTFQLVNWVIAILLTHLAVFELGRKKGMRDIKRVYENSLALSKPSKKSEI